MKVIEEKLKSRTAVGDIRQYERFHCLLPEPLQYNFAPATNPSRNTHHSISVDRGSVLEQRTEKFLLDDEREHIWTVVICTHLSNFRRYPTGNLLLILIYLNIIFRQSFVANLDSSTECLKARHWWTRIELRPWVRDTYDSSKRPESRVTHQVEKRLLTYIAIRQASRSSEQWYSLYSPSSRRRLLVYLMNVGVYYAQHRRLLLIIRKTIVIV